MGAGAEEGATSSWPEFRGPTGQGIADKAPRAWGLKEGVAWKVPVGPQGWSSPVISEGLIVLTGATGEGEGTRLHVMALDEKTGAEIWSKELFAPTAEELKAKHAKNSLASSTPVIRDGVVYVHFGHMGTAALKLNSGAELWRQKIVYKPMHGSASSPILVGDLMVFSADGDEDPVLMALHTDSGKVAWKTPRGHEVIRSYSFATPLVVDNKGRQEIVSPASGMVGGYEPKDGSLIWKVAYDEGFSVVPRPVAMDGMVYLSTSFMKPQLLAIKLDGQKGVVTDSNVAWVSKKHAPKTPSFVAAQGVLYVLDDTGAVTCFDGKSGEVKWRAKLAGNFSSSPILADGALYCLTEDGVCYVLEVSPEAGKVVFELDLEERLFASPAAVGGALYLRSETHLWKIVGSGAEGAGG
jgi:outer membrane protein assembly factor BamB